MWIAAPLRFLQGCERVSRKVRRTGKQDGSLLVTGQILVDCFTLFITAVRLKREQIQLVVDGDVVGTGVAARKGLLQGHLLEKSD